MVSKADGKFRIFKNSKLNLIDRMVSSESGSEWCRVYDELDDISISGVQCDTDL